MFTIKQMLSRKDRKVVEHVLYDICDLYNDFYCTKDNVRIAYRDNPEILFKDLSKGDKIIVDADGEEGVGIITGWSDSSPRKYVKILTKDANIADRILKTIGFNIKIDLYAKLKKNNKFLKTFQRNGFKFQGDRGQEVLLCRKYIPRKDFTFLILKEKGDLINSEDIYYKRKK